MPEALKNTLLVIAGAVGVLLIIGLIVAIGCAVNGVTFGEQICNWFGSHKATIEQIADTTAKITMP